jgi:Mn2+/Fe2+ NRAMP family transporter
MPDSHIGMIVAAAVFVVLIITLFVTGRQGHRCVLFLVLLVVLLTYTCFCHVNHDHNGIHVCSRLPALSVRLTRQPHTPATLLRCVLI